MVKGAVMDAARLDTKPALKRRRRHLPWFALTILGVMLVCAVFAPFLAPHSPTQLNIINADRPPLETNSYFLGTDKLGRDILSRLIYGAQSSVVIAIIGLGGSAVLGTFIGVISGYIGGRLDDILMRLVDVTMAFPTILTALVVALYLGTGTGTLIVAVMASLWARFARMIRGDVRVIREHDFVTLARISGVNMPTILMRHILPNIVNTLMVVASLLVGEVILLQASLSFLGLGLPPGSPAWGVMVAEGRAVLSTVWWLSIFPGVAITVVVLAMNLLGDWLRDAFDPRLRQL